MNIQPNSSALRQYIPPEKYFQMQEAQRSRSYIGLPLNFINEENIKSRIAALEALEIEGFVYVGEKNWLQFYLDNNRSFDFENYHDWVLFNFENFLQLDFEVSGGLGGSDQTIWQTELNTEGLVLPFSQLQNLAFLALDDLEILIGGDAEALHPALAIKAFEFLHNLEYAIFDIPYQPSGGGQVSATGVDVSNQTDPCRWELNVISGYGSEWDFTIVNGVAFRY